MPESDLLGLKILIWGLWFTAQALIVGAWVYGRRPAWFKVAARGSLPETTSEAAKAVVAVLMRAKDQVRPGPAGTWTAIRPGEGGGDFKGVSFYVELREERPSRRTRVETIQTAMQTLMAVRDVYTAFGGERYDCEIEISSPALEGFRRTF